MTKLSGFTRGLDLAGPFTFIGLSHVRETVMFDGLRITVGTKERKRRRGGIAAVDDRRYSCGTVVDVIATPRLGDPDEDRICTSHVERSNKTLRMGIRRLTRLTDAHSKKWENHEAAMAFYFSYYNFCRRHGTIKMTPAMKAGLTVEPWSVERLLTEAGRI